MLSPDAGALKLAASSSPPHVGPRRCGIPACCVARHSAHVGAAQRPGEHRCGPGARSMGPGLPRARRAAAAAPGALCRWRLRKALLPFASGRAEWRCACSTSPREWRLRKALLPFASRRAEWRRACFTSPREWRRGKAPLSFASGRAEWRRACSTSPREWRNGAGERRRCHSPSGARNGAARAPRAGLVEPRCRASDERGRHGERCCGPWRVTYGHGYGRRYGRGHGWRRDGAGRGARGVPWKLRRSPVTVPHPLHSAPAPLTARAPSSRPHGPLVARLHACRSTRTLRRSRGHMP
jgi:hypothetical protein